MASYYDEDTVVCGHCKWHKSDPWDWENDWACTNENSDCYGSETEYLDTCPDFEARA